MAELAETKEGEAPVTSDCCGAEAQAECCEPTDKAECCTPESSSCGCSAGEADGEEIRDAVRSRYAAAATSVAEKSATGESCCGSSTALTDEEAKAFGASLYDEDSQGELPDTATMASLGCGNPTAVAELGEGETVLDLGSGGGIDVLLSRQAGRPDRQGLRARHDRRDARPGPRERSARRASRTSSSLRARSSRSRFPQRRVDVVISNCVINLSGDKPSGACRGRAGAEARGALRRLRCGRRRGHGRRHPGRHGPVDRLHRRRADSARVRGRADRRRTRATSRSPRPTASTTRPPRRSSAPASRWRHDRDAPLRPAGSLRPLGGRANGRRSTIDLAATKSSGSTSARRTGA